MRKLILPLVTVAALTAVALVPTNAHASWLSQALRGQSGYYGAPYGYPVQSYGYYSPGYVPAIPDYGYSYDPGYTYYQPGYSYQYAYPSYGYGTSYYGGQSWNGYRGGWQGGY